MMSFFMRLLQRDSRLPAWRTLLYSVCVAIAALTAVGRLASRMEKLLVAESHSVLAADARLLSDHPVPAYFMLRASQSGLQQANQTIFPSMARKGDAITLVSVKAVSPAYPLRGKLMLAPDGRRGNVPASGEVLLDERAAALLEARAGDHVQLGNISLKVNALLQQEPDGGGDFGGVQPRLLMNEADLAATGLLGPGSRVRYRLLIAGSSEAVAAWQAEVKLRLGKGERLEDGRDTQPEIKTALERAQRFLRLSALICACLAGVAMLLAARRYAMRRFDEVAIFSALGASRRRIGLVLLVQLLWLLLLASLLGGMLGWAGESLLMYGMRDQLPTIIPQADWYAWGQATGMASLLLLGGAGPMLYSLSRTPPLRVLRREIAPTVSVWLSRVLLGIVFMAMMLELAGELRLAAYTAGAMLVAIMLAGLMGLSLLYLLRQFWSQGVIGLAVRQILRRKGLALLQLGALAAGLLGVWLLTLIEGDLLATWREKLSGDVPNHFAINILPEQRAGFETLFQKQGLAHPLLQPVIRGRLLTRNGQAVESLPYQDERARHQLEHEFNLSWGDTLRKDNRLLAGQPLGDRPGWSVEEGLAKTLNIHLGDRLGFDVGGTRVEAPVLNLRTVEWDSFRVNFFITGNAGLLQPLPASLITSFNVPQQNKRLILQIAQTYPNVTVIDVGQLLAEARRMLDLATAALRLVFSFCIAAAITVMWAALDATEAERGREAAILRALGASSSRLRQVWLLESILLGGVAGWVAGVAASGAGWWIGSRLLQMDTGFNLWLPWFSLAVGALLSSLVSLRRLSRLAHTPALLLLREEAG